MEIFMSFVCLILAFFIYGIWKHQIHIIFEICLRIFQTLLAELELLIINLHHSIFNSKLFHLRPGGKLCEEWLANVLRENEILAEGIDVVNIDKAECKNGAMNATHRIKLTYSNQTNAPKSLIIKMREISALSRFVSKYGGFAREAHVFETLIDIDFIKHGRLMPKYYYSYHSMWRGDIVIVMEDLEMEATISGYYFKNVMLDKQLPLPLGLSQFEMTAAIFTQIARLHAHFWNDPNVLNESKLKYADWIRGKNRAEFDFLMFTSNKVWKKCIQLHKNNKLDIVIPEKLMNIVTKSFEYTTWERLQAYVQNPEFNYTMIHGDFQPLNILWRQDDKENPVCFIDWAEVAVWESAADIGTYLFLQFERSYREQYKLELIEIYWKMLTKQGVNAHEFPLTRCVHQTKLAGMARFIFALPYTLIYTKLSQKVKQHLIHQIMDFYDENFSDSREEFLLKF